MANLTTNAANTTAVQTAFSTVNAAPDMGSAGGRIQSLYSDFIGGIQMGDFGLYSADETFVSGWGGPVDFELDGSFNVSGSGGSGVVHSMLLDDFTHSLEVRGAINVAVGSGVALSGSVSRYIYQSSDFNFDITGGGAISLGGIASSFPATSVSYVFDDFFSDRVSVRYTGALQYNGGTGTLSGTLTSASFTITDSDTFAVTTLNFTGLSHNASALFAPGGNLLAAATVLTNLLNGNDTVNGAAAAESLNGYAGNDTMNGLDGNDTLIGGLGNDILRGGAGNDALRGAEGNDTLDGGAGNDDMQGGAGNDTYVMNAGDAVAEALNAGTDTVQAGFSYTLGANIENLVLLAGATGTGNTLNNSITGNAAANTINGMAGADTMTGLGGNDTYVVDAAGDVVVEAANAGSDTVQSSITYTLGANVENLTLTGGANINGNGNAFNNIINGNTGNNIIDGKAGADTMAGGLGDDQYFIDNVGDVITEAGGQGNDTVRSGFTVNLLAQYINVENVILTGVANIGVTGNADGNTLIGNSGNNTLNGAQGIDNMQGGLGNDTYFIHNVGDLVTEALNAGTDTVRTVIDYTLTANVENLVLLSGNINGTGNTLNNVLTGSTGDNVLHGGGGIDTVIGGDGNDTLDGGIGNDILTGGLGNDIFRFSSQPNAATNIDTVDFAAGDSFLLYDNIFTALVTPGTLAAGSFVSGAGAVALDGDDFIIYDTTTGGLFYDADGNGAAAAIRFAQLTGAPVLANTDINIV